MGFKDAWTRVIKALSDGNIQFERRSVVEGKHLLETGEISSTEVIDLLQSCRGDQYDESPHHFSAEILVHIFKPTRLKQSWYIKVYFATAPMQTVEDDAAVFISVHKSTYRREQKP